MTVLSVLSVMYDGCCIVQCFAEPHLGYLLSDFVSGAFAFWQLDNNNKKFFLKKLKWDDLLNYAKAHLGDKFELEKNIKNLCCTGIRSSVKHSCID